MNNSKGNLRIAKKSFRNTGPIRGGAWRESQPPGKLQPPKFLHAVKRGRRAAGLETKARGRVTAVLDPAAGEARLPELFLS